MSKGPPIIWTREKIVEALHAHAENGTVGYRALPGGLRGAIEREFGAGAEGWRAACKVAKLKPKGRGRPSQPLRRAACAKCGRDIAVKKDGGLVKHKCAE